MVAGTAYGTGIASQLAQPLADIGIVQPYDFLFARGMASACWRQAAAYVKREHPL